MNRSRRRTPIRGDTLTYRLGGRDAAVLRYQRDKRGSFARRTGVTLTADEIYTVTVVADDDGSDIARRLRFPSRPPTGASEQPARVYVDGTPAPTRSVRASDAASGTNDRQPRSRRRTPIAGTTLIYSLEGADAASFGINPANGQLLTVAGVTLDRSTYTLSTSSPAMGRQPQGLLLRSR